MQDGIFLQLAFHYHLIRLSVALQREEKERGVGEKKCQCKKACRQRERRQECLFSIVHQKGIISLQTQPTVTVPSYSTVGVLGVI